MQQFPFGQVLVKYMVGALNVTNMIISFPFYFQISLREGCKKILVADSFGLMRRLVKTQKKAISVESKFMKAITVFVYVYFLI